MVPGGACPVLRKAEPGVGVHWVQSFCETQCQEFYDQKKGRPSLAPGVYFRLMMLGFFEGIDSERGIAWRVADSLSLRQFIG